MFFKLPLILRGARTARGEGLEIKCPNSHFQKHTRIFKKNKHHCQTKQTPLLKNILAFLRLNLPFLKKPLPFLRNVSAPLKLKSVEKHADVKTFITVNLLQLHLALVWIIANCGLLGLSSQLNRHKHELHYVQTKTIFVYKFRQCGKRFRGSYIKKTT